MALTGVGRPSPKAGSTISWVGAPGPCKSRDIQLSNKDAHVHFPKLLTVDVTSCLRFRLP